MIAQSPVSEQLALLLQQLLSSGDPESVHDFFRKLRVFFLFPAPAPQVTCPTAGCSVTPGTIQKVCVTTNINFYTYTVSLLDTSGTSTTTLSSVTVSAGSKYPKKVELTIPPGTGIVNYTIQISVDLGPGPGGGVYTHSIVVTTDPGITPCESCDPCP